MSSSFLSTFDCVQSSRALLLKENDSTTFNLPQQNVLGLTKLAYSLKQKKIIQKPLLTKRSCKTFRRPSTRIFQQKQNVEETQNPVKQVKTLQIIRQVAVKCQPEHKSIQSQTERSLNNFSHVKMLSCASIFELENLRSTQEMQPCGAQSVVLLSHTRLKKQISSQSTQCKCQTAENSSINMFSKGNLEQRQLLRQGKSEKSLLDLIQTSYKTYTSVVMPGKFKFSKIDEESSDKSQSLKDRNTYSYKNAFQRNQPRVQQKATQNSSTFAMNNSIIQSFRSKIHFKKNLNDMEIRSTKSIKEEESVDQFSEVLSRTCLSSSSKKISVSGLILSRKLYHEE